MNFDPQYFAAKVCGARNELRMSQTEFAKAIGVNKNTISNLENGKNTPGADTIMAICSVTGKTPNELLGWKPHAA